MHERTASDWTRVESFLDEALHTLDETDRAAVLLATSRTIPARSRRNPRTSDDAAQKRVSRAVERLREFLSKTLASPSARAGLVVVISAMPSKPRRLDWPSPFPPLPSLLELPFQLRP